MPKISDLNVIGKHESIGLAIGLLSIGVRTSQIESFVKNLRQDEISSLYREMHDGKSPAGGQHAVSCMRFLTSKPANSNNLSDGKVSSREAAAFLVNYLDIIGDNKKIRDASAFIKAVNTSFDELHTLGYEPRIDGYKCAIILSDWIFGNIAIKKCRTCDFYYIWANCAQLQHCPNCYSSKYRNKRKRKPVA